MGLGEWLRFFHVSRCFRSRFEEQQRLKWSEQDPTEVEQDLVVKAAYEVLHLEGWVYSPRIAQMIKERRNNPKMDQVESEVESSRVTWSELSSSELGGAALAADNVRVFKALQEQWGDKFFQQWREGEWELVGKFAEGAQAELFELRRMRFVNDELWVMKMFKEGFSLEDLQGLLPRGMLADAATRNWGYFHGGSSCNAIRGAMLFDGRFALLMDRKWGDLRKLIDGRMVFYYNKSTQLTFPWERPPFPWDRPPFKGSEAARCMLQIARGMEALHKKNIIHGDLKAANILVCGVGSQLENPHVLDPLGDSFDFQYYVADYECSVGVLGTGFWRAPEILLAVKNRNVTPETFTKESDVYSYGMTCYEILTSRVPFELEGFKDNEYDRVIGGYRPFMGGHLWIDRSHDEDLMNLMRRCWHPNPSERPTFKLVCDEIQSVITSNPSYQ